MKKIIFIIIYIFIWSFTCLFGGYFLGKKLTKPITITQTETVWKDKIIYKDIPSMTISEKDKELRCYYRSEFKLNFKPLIDDNKYRIEGILCERSAYKDIEIECGESENWKFYVGAGVVLGLGTAIYTITR